MKPIKFKNIMTGEQVICFNPKHDKQYIDGIEFLIVRRNTESRPFLMRRDALEKVQKTYHAS
jgi:hypothetical protein